MTDSDKIKLVALAKKAITTSLRENGIDDGFMDIINPNAESATDINTDELCIIMWIEGYLRCKKENQNIIENMMNEGKSASEIFSSLVGKDYVYNEETKTRSFKE